MLDFIESFNNSNPRFLEVLLKRYPSLTQREILLCMYLKLNYSSDEISSSMKITRASVDTYRHNLRKKFDLARTQSLISHLNTIVK